MARAIGQALSIIVVFTSIYVGLSQINWVKILKVKQITETTDEKIGDLLWELFQANDVEVSSDLISSVDSLLMRLCTANEIEREKIQLHILLKDEINAFALPDNHLVIYSGLITACEKQGELLGVMAHELAHIEKNHVMKKLIREIGLTTLISMTTGGGGGDVLKETARMVSSNGFDRSLEKEADLLAVDYMINARLNPDHFAEFLYLLSQSEPGIMKQMSWLSTHPISSDRVEYVTEYGEGRSKEHHAVLTDEEWLALQESFN